MYIVLGIFCACVLFFLVGAIASSWLKVNHFVISGEDTKGLHGFRIVLISDLHGRTIGKNQEKLVDAILAQGANLLVMAGDMIDAYDNDAKAAAKLVEQLDGKIDMIAVRGNHFYKACEEAQAELENVFSDYGVTSLKNERVCLSYKEMSICIDGIDDPIAVVGYKGISMKECVKRNRVAVKNSLSRLQEDNVKSDYNILLCHRPTDVDLFERAGYNLALCGHTHGGQWALPFGIQILGDEATLFPPKNMQSGMHIHNKMPLIITSGIGYSNIKLRTFLPPEIAVITFG